ncbi:hypothetical protein QE152_g11051 [Popillia japonica]|uniref:Uncharacterized protein n=1 Tax=Popillia japonica TaxID=7064 RepID=A0AAW1LRD7_POPJA
MGLAKSTVQNIRDGSKEIEAHSLSAAPFIVSKLTRQRSNITKKMEKLLDIWSEGNNQRGMPMSQMTIQEKAESEAASADDDAAKEYPSILKGIIEKVLELDTDLNKFSMYTREESIGRTYSLAKLD